jgi:hypothetical protein
LRDESTHYLLAKIGLIEKLNLLEQQPVLYRHELLDVEVKETAAHLPQFLPAPCA